jgi:hypothetical protein
MRHCACFIFVLILFGKTVAAQDGDKLERGLDDWKAEKKKVDKRMVQAFEKVKANTKKNKSLPAETRNRYIEILDVQQTQFESSQTLPVSDLMLQPTIEYLDSLHAKATPLRRLFDQALEREVGNRLRFDEIAKSKEKWQAELPGRDELASNTEWHGNRTFSSGTTIDFHFHVFEIKDNSFKGHIWQDVGSVSGKSGWEFEAKREGNQILLTTTKMLHGAARTIAFRGYVIERRIVLTQTSYNGKPVNDGGLVSIWKK